MKVLLITYVEFDNIISGSSVRPVKMFNAFKELGEDVMLLEGNYAFNEQEKRKKNIKKINLWLNNNRPDYCYVESPVYPLLLCEDVKLLKRIANSEIPIAYFIRDFRYMFRKEFGIGKNSLVKEIKTIILRMLYSRDKHLIKKIATIVYFPSQSCLQYFNYDDMRVLMPGCSQKEIIPKKDNTKTLIYVGGISFEYGVERLIKSMQILNHDSIVYKLIIVCREREYNEFLRQRVEEQKNPWLEIYSLNNSELNDVYQQADVGMLPIENQIYTNLAIPIKTFEYIENGLPIIATPCHEIEKIVVENKIGVVADDFSIESYVKAIKKIMNNEILFNICKNNVSLTLKSNYWIDRATQVRDEISAKVKNQKLC